MPWHQLVESLLEDISSLSGPVCGGFKVAATWALWWFLQCLAAGEQLCISVQRTGRLRASLEVVVVVVVMTRGVFQGGGSFLLLPCCSLSYNSSCIFASSSSSSSTSLMSSTSCWVREEITKKLLKSKSTKYWAKGYSTYNNHFLTWVPLKANQNHQFNLRTR